MNDIKVATTDEDVAHRIEKAFHGLTGYAHGSHKSGKLFLVGTDATEKVGVEALRRVAEGIIREDDIAIII